MPAEITELTPAQIARFGEWVEKWTAIALSTEPADFDRATAAALRAYELINFQRPMVILRMGSPFGAAFGGALARAMLRNLGSARSELKSRVRSKIESEVWVKIEWQVREHVESQVRSQVELRVRSQVWPPLEQQIWSQVQSQIQSEVGSQVESQVRSQVELQVRSQVWAKVESQGRSRAAASSYTYNLKQCAFSAPWGAFVSFLRDVANWSDPILERSKIDEDLIRSCGWIWWHENVLAISDRPSAINRDAQGRLHGESGPSIAFRDGRSLWHSHGVPVPHRNM